MLVLYVGGCFRFKKYKYIRREGNSTEKKRKNTDLKKFTSDTEFSHEHCKTSQLLHELLEMQTSTPEEMAILDLTDEANFTAPQKN